MGSDIQKEYTQYDREHTFKETDPMSERDPIYAGVESAPFHELLLEKIGQTEIYLDGVPPNSKV
jgi:hypothetical protein